MQVLVKIQGNGQAIIPAEVIRRIGGQPDAELVIDVDAEHATLHVESISGEPNPLYTRDISPDKSVHDLLDEYEKKYHMTSEEFWEKYKAGVLDHTVEFNDWAGHYEHKLYLDSIGVDPRATTFELIVRAPDIRFDRPNLEFLIREIETSLLNDK